MFIRDSYYTERTISFQKDGVQFDVVVLAYDDCLAFRYVIHAEDGTEIQVQDLSLIHIYTAKWYMPC